MRKTIRKYRDLEDRHGYLNADSPLPRAKELVSVLGPAVRPRQNVNTVEPYGSMVEEHLSRGCQPRFYMQHFSVLILLSVCFLNYLPYSFVFL